MKIYITIILTKWQFIYNLFYKLIPTSYHDQSEKKQQPKNGFMTSFEWVATKIWTHSYRFTLHLDVLSLLTGKLYGMITLIVRIGPLIGMWLDDEWQRVYLMNKHQRAIFEPYSFIEHVTNVTTRFIFSHDRYLCAHYMSLENCALYILFNIANRLSLQI